jgi:hypothetical protein
MNVAWERETKRIGPGKKTASITNGTQKPAHSCILSGLKYHVIDAEGRMSWNERMLRTDPL